MKRIRILLAGAVGLVGCYVLGAGAWNGDELKMINGQLAIIMSIAMRAETVGMSFLRALGRVP